MNNFQLDIFQHFSVNWEAFGHVLEWMETPPTDIHSEDDITSIQVFGDFLHNAFQVVAKPRQRVVDAFQLPENIKDLKREINCLDSGKPS